MADSKQEQINEEVFQILGIMVYGLNEDAKKHMEALAKLIKEGRDR